MALGKCRECDTDVSSEAKTCPKCGVNKPVTLKSEQSISDSTPMKMEDRLKAYQNFAELGRKWSQVMDAKAGFLSALNMALLVFIWTGAKLGAESGCIHYIALSATTLAFISLFISVNVVFPRTTLKNAFGKKLKSTHTHRAVSFYGYVAKNYPPEKYVDFMAAVDGMNEDAFASEALEQHFTISHVVKKKSDGVEYASMFWFLALALVIVALFVKG